MAARLIRHLESIRRLTLALFLLASVVSTSTARADGAKLIVAGPAGELSPVTPYWTDGSLAEFRGALERGLNFGACGIVLPGLQTVTLDRIDAASLAGVNVFVAPAWADGSATPAAREAVAQFFLAGGNLLLLDDSSQYDPIGERLGIPTLVDSDGSASVGGAPLLSGPFGAAPSVVQAGLHGALSADTVQGLGGTVGATNASGQITAAFWRRGEYAPGAGALVVLTDVDMIRTSAAFSPMNANGVLALNAMAFLTNAEPTPAFRITGRGGVAPDGTLGVSGFLIEDFESVSLRPELQVQIDDGAPTSTLGQTFDPRLDDPYGSAFAGANWDGRRVLLNTAGNAPGNYGLAQDWRKLTLRFPQGAISVGFATQQLTSNLTLLVNGVALGGIFTLAPQLPQGGQPSYVRIDAREGERIYSITLDNGGNGDGFAIDHVAILPRPIVVAGLDGATAGPITPYWTDGSLAAFRHALEDPANFGACGQVGRPVQTVTLSSISAESLAGVDVFVAPAWMDAYATAQQLEALQQFFHKGGSLFLLDDNWDYDVLGQKLGLPTSTASDGSPSAGLSPLFEGPFGTTPQVSHWGVFGQLDACTVAAKHGSVVGWNQSRQATTAIWPRDTYAPGAGAMVVATDVDMIRNGASYAPLNGNGVFALNAMAFLTEGTWSGAFQVSSFGPQSWGAPDASLGVEGFLIEDFEDTTLVPGLELQLDDLPASTVLANTFTPEQDAFGTVFRGGNWDGQRVLLNTLGNVSGDYGSDAHWRRLTFRIPAGTRSFGFSLEQMQSSVLLRVNGKPLGGLGTVAPNLALDGERNGYVRIDARAGLIYTVELDNEGGGWPGDGYAFDHVAIAPPSAPVAGCDPCLFANGGCAQTCQSSGGAVACGCAAGQTLASDGKSCIANTCSTSNGGCDALTTCSSDSAGSVQCGACPGGYQGTGKTGCVDVDECAGGTVTCGAHAHCVNRPGSYDCGCDAGYMKEGGACVPVHTLVTIDATALSAQHAYVQGVTGYLPAATPFTVDLGVGTYTLREAGDNNGVDFSIDPSGAIALHAGTESFLEVAGNTLRVVPFTITVDATELTALWGRITNETEWRYGYSTNSVPHVAHVIPGHYRFNENGSNNEFGYDVGADGNITYSPSLEYDPAAGHGFLSGAGTPVLKLHPFTIWIDATALSARWARVANENDGAGYRPTAEPMFARVIPGGYQFNENGQNNGFAFQIDAWGHFSYDPAFEWTPAAGSGFLTGGGSGHLVIHPFTIVVDATALSASNVRLTNENDGFGYQPNTAPTSARVIPGVYYFNENGANNGFGFLVSNGGAISYDPALDAARGGYLALQSDGSLRVLGYPLSICAQNLSAAAARVDNESDAHGYNPTGQLISVRLIPGGYNFSENGANNGLGLSMSLGGTVQTAPQLVSSAIVSGSGTARLDLRGVAVRVDASALGAGTYRVDNELGYTDTGAAATLYLIPGGYHFAGPGADFYFYVSATQELTGVDPRVQMQAVENTRNLTCDPCASSNGGCAQTCTASGAAVVCSCGAGFALGADSTTCVLQACPPNASGAPLCACDAGYQGNLAFSGGSWTGTCAPALLDVTVSAVDESGALIGIAPLHLYDELTGAHLLPAGSPNPGHAALLTGSRYLRVAAGAYGLSSADDWIFLNYVLPAAGLQAGKTYRIDAATKLLLTVSSSPSTQLQLVFNTFPATVAAVDQTGAVIPGALLHVFDESTGVHLLPAGAANPGELRLSTGGRALRVAAGDGALSSVDDWHFLGALLPAEGFQPGKTYRLDVKTGTLSVSDGPSRIELRFDLHPFVVETVDLTGAPIAGRVRTYDDSVHADLMPGGAAASPQTILLARGGNELRIGAQASGLGNTDAWTYLSSLLPAEGFQPDTTYRVDTLGQRLLSANATPGQSRIQVVFPLCPEGYGVSAGGTSCAPLNTAPVALCRDVTVKTAPGTCTAATASVDGGTYDPDAGDSLRVTQSPAGPFALGATAVTLVASDAHGASSSCSATVFVEDGEAPVLKLPAPMVAEATSVDGAVVTFAAGATDNCSNVTVDCTPHSGSTFALGTTSVTCAATDTAGNQARGSFEVTVKDTTAPTLRGCADVTTSSVSAAGATVTFAVSATDTADATVPVTCVSPSGSLFPLGTSQVACSARDDAGNVGSCSFNVTVVAQRPQGCMTGGGTLPIKSGAIHAGACAEASHVSHGFELRCDGTHSTLQLTWQGNRFHLDQLTSVVCSDDPAISVRAPAASFDTLRGTGIGRYNDRSGATVEFTLSDAGEPGRSDMASLRVKDAGGRVVLEVSGKLHGGNHQAHDRCGRDSCSDGDHRSGEDDGKGEREGEHKSVGEHND